MPLPNLLIIGAMKAGTTGLYMDMASHPQVFLAHDKEPHALCSDDVLTAEGLRRYEAIYEKARRDQVCCDASTGYSKRPDFEGVAQRAAGVLPAGFKVIYVVRHPIDRIISQHHHEHFEGRVGPSIDEEVRRHARYVQYSRYSYQLEPWLSVLGRDRIRVIRFEDYVERRQDTVRDLYRFLGLADEGCAVEEERVYNKSQGKPVKNRFWHAIQHNAAYRKILRPLAPPGVRLAIRRLLLAKATTSIAPPQRETVLHLHEALIDDVRRLNETLGLEKPLWSDFESTAGESSSVAPVTALNPGANS
jgi:hypothetical protein